MSVFCGLSVAGLLVLLVLVLYVKQKGGGGGCGCGGDCGGKGVRGVRG